MHFRRIFLILLIILFFGAYFLYPWKAVNVAPAFRVRVLDEAGSPAPGAIVQERWEYSSIVSTEYREIFRADENGYASFPERTVRISLLNYALTRAINNINSMHGYGYGAKLTVWAYGDDPHVWNYVPFNLHREFPSNIQLKRNNVPRTPNDAEYP